ncbi:MAG: ArsR/SmtB family transcription factor [Thermoplasmata archaeon]
MRRPPARVEAISDEAFELEAETLRALAHPKRLMILHLLGDSSLTVTALAGALHLSLPNASQHLRILRDRGIVRSERVGQGVRYRVANPAIRTCCRRVREILVDQVRRHGVELHTAAPRAVAHHEALADALAA